MFKKNDVEKTRLELIDPSFIVGIGDVLTQGAMKYDAYNWQKATEEDKERIKGAMLRHQMSYMSGEKVDTESGLNHMYHIACNAMFLAFFDIAGTDHPDQTYMELAVPGEVRGDLIFGGDNWYNIHSEMGKLLLSEK